MKGLVLAYMKVLLANMEGQVLANTKGVLLANMKVLLLDYWITWGYCWLT